MVIEGSTQEIAEELGNTCETLYVDKNSCREMATDCLSS